MSETKKRVKVGGVILAPLLAVAIASWIPGASGIATVPPEALEVSLYSYKEGNIRVRVETVEGQQLLNAADVGLGEPVPFRVNRGDCDRTIYVWINGRRHSVTGNLCPENYPDEVKTLVLPRTGRPLAVGEDRD